MSVTEVQYDDEGKVHLHDSCVTDVNQPTFEADWQRRAFGLAVALSEFDHYKWDAFQAALIEAITAWEKDADPPASWAYYDHWVAALEQVVQSHGLLADGYVGPRDRRDDHEHEHDH